MKTTVDLPDDLLIRAKKLAAETRTPLRILIERGLRRELSSSAGRRARSIPRNIKWVVAPGGLPPGLDVSDRSSLHDCAAPCLGHAARIVGSFLDHAVFIEAPLRTARKYVR